MSIQLEARNARFEDVLTLLERQHETKYDAVVPSTHLRYEAGRLVVTDGATRITDEGVDSVDALFDPTEQFDGHIAERLNVPLQYLRRMRSQESALGLLDTNVNHWLAETPKNWFVRAFRDTEPDAVGIARAFLSDRYNVIDHLDAVTAVLDGVRQGGVANIRISSADLSETKLRLKIEAPEITARVPDFTRNYRGPGGVTGLDEDRVSAGLVVTNSETGGAAFSIAPQITVLVCQNGMTRTVDAMRKIHIGQKMETGAITWSENTKRKSIELITAQATDAVQAFLSSDYLERVAAEIEEQGQALLDRPLEVLDSVGKKLRYSDTERESILAHFIDGGDTHASGVVQAFTAYARDLDSPDRAAEVEEQAFEILALAASN